MTKVKSSISEELETFWSLGTAGCRTKDVFIQHPSQPSLWKYHNRTDDILVLGIAGQTNPIPTENTIAKHLHFSGVLIAGAIQAELMIQLFPNIEAVKNSETFASSGHGWSLSFNPGLSWMVASRARILPSNATFHIAEWQTCWSCMITECFESPIF
ncbi:hypothetical protein AC579_704 [Pseudocercospora musae]|uniref:Uncharacterized protein n=1 Tax=Pseudocercospora musae TaxID=113226 RepID=A0A139ICL2_9PEZI|nr:hypothetical protein AC579_704 [Pseudocercospora musae]